MATEIAIVMRLRDLVSGPMRHLEDNMRAFKREVSQSMDATLKMGGALTAGVTLPLAFAGREMLRTSARFEEQLHLLEALSGATGKEMASLGTLARRLGRDTQFSASDAAEAMGVLAQSGYDVNAILSATPEVLNLAAASAMSMAEAAETLSDAMASFRIPAEKLAGVNDTLARSANLTASSVASLREGMRYAGPAASMAGMSYEDTNAALGLIHQSGIKGTMAGTSFAAMLSRMFDIPREAQHTWGKLGFKKSDIFDPRTGRLQDLGSLLARLQEKGATLEDLTKLFGIEGARAAGALMGTKWQGKQGPEALLALQEDLGLTSAAANVREALLSLRKPTEEVRASLEKMGLSSSQGLPHIFARLRKATDAELSRLFPLGEGARVVREASVGGHADTIEERLGEGGEAHKFAEARSRGLLGATRELASAWEEMEHVLVVDSGLLGRLESWVRALTRWLNALSEKIRTLPRWQTELGMGLASLAAAAGPALVGVALFGKALTAARVGAGLLLSPLSGLTSRLPLLVGLLNPLALALVGAAAAFGGLAFAGKEGMTSLFASLGGFLEQAPSEIRDFVDSLLASLEAGLEDAPKIWESVFARLLGDLEVASQSLPSLFEKMAPVLESLLLGLGRLVAALASKLLLGLLLALPKVSEFVSRLGILLLQGLWEVGKLLPEVLFLLTESFLEALSKKVSEVFGSLVAWGLERGKSLVGGIGEAIEGVLSRILSFWEKAKSVAKIAGAIGGLAPVSLGFAAPVDVSPAARALEESKKQDVGGEISVGVSFTNVPSGTKIESQSKSRGPIALDPRLGVTMAGRP